MNGKPFHNLELNKIRRLFEVNFFAPINLIKKLWNNLENGLIVNICSVAS